MSGGAGFIPSTVAYPLPTNFLMVFRFFRLGEISDLFFVEGSWKIFRDWRCLERNDPNSISAKCWFLFHGSMKSNALDKMVIYQVRRNQKYSTRMGRIISSGSDSFSQK